MYVTRPPFDMSGLKIDRGEIFDPGQNGNGHYMRYRFTESGISPRSIPGQEGGIFWTTSDEHDQVGHITEGIGNRLAMMRKRMGKMALAAAEIPEAKKFTLFGPAKAPVSVVSWGSTKGAILDALARLDPAQQNFNFIQVRIFHPFPEESLRRILEQSGKVVVMECNYSGQLASLLREKIGIKAHHRVLKYEGRPFSEDEVVAALEAATSNGGEDIIIAEDA
jgi:2-oxoglutarate ferredoxin oxidoreductase subunit alpha